MMHNYEHTIITKQDLSETQTKKVINKYEDLIKANAGEIIKTEQWGLRNFSHLIKKNKKGFYIHFKFKGTGKVIEELEKAENIDEALVRYLTVRVKEHDLKTNYFEKKTL